MGIRKVFSKVKIGERLEISILRKLESFAEKIFEILKKTFPQN